MSIMEINPVFFADQHNSNYTPKRKSSVRLNDQLIPKPTDINIGEKIIKIATPKEHPYASHIPRFAMFPHYCSSEDSAEGEVVVSQPVLDSTLPNSPLTVTLLSKTKGGPYRHEVLKPPTRANKKAVTWSGDHDLLEPFQGERQVFYPTPTKMMLPNPKQQKWDLSDRTSSMLKNLEGTHWLTSYQMHYTGSGQANLLKMDEFKKKLNSLTGMNSHTAPLREKSVPVFVPSKPREGCQRTKGPSLEMTAYSPTTAQLPFPAPFPGTASTPAPPQRPQESSAHCNEAPEPNQSDHSELEYSSVAAEAQSTDLSHRVSHKQQTERSECETRPRENGTEQFEKRPVKISMAQYSEEASHNIDPERPLHHRKMTGMSRNKEKDYSTVGRDHERRLPCSTSNPCILPRPSVLPGIRPVCGDGIISSLRDLQDSFSRTQAHRNFNNTITHAPVDLRDNVCTGRRHDFYGVNSFYLHG